MPVDPHRGIMSDATRCPRRPQITDFDTYRKLLAGSSPIPTVSQCFLLVHTQAWRLTEYICRAPASQSKLNVDAAAPAPPALGPDAPSITPIRPGPYLNAHLPEGAVLIPDRAGIVLSAPSLKERHLYR